MYSFLSLFFFIYCFPDFLFFIRISFLFSFFFFTFPFFVPLFCSTFSLYSFFFYAVPFIFFLPYFPAIFFPSSLLAILISSFLHSYSFLSIFLLPLFHLSLFFFLLVILISTFSILTKMSPASKSIYQQTQRICMDVFRLSYWFVLFIRNGVEVG